ncbi:RsmD family RNA methyltransferase [Herbiconiux sp. L3-i23]|uniref:RsmD family RNA methyltransferase n=1 Tax=Herbiconiux sp. L3-i23 TaxID=2905871 RepID=UPI00206B5C80|nr:RsmD family RNA methyltransferase [Herbiconiux sp. L3-i23]BDI21832.1 methyltransferase [Herbiconiux sp. L3-i23]
MTRIISGFAGSLALRVPRSGTRPTSDRTREGIFSALVARDAIDEARVLDLYAGSGALGLEAVSRGATSAVLVDRSHDAATVCRRNAQIVLKAAPAPSALSIEVAARPVLGFLEHASAEWDLVFIDPPYEVDEAEIAAVLTHLGPRLAPDSTVVLERSTRSPAPAWPDGYHPQRSREYGETAVYFATTD